MAKLKLSDAPGCIGSPLIRAENHPICRNCGFKVVCAKLAARNEERLKEELGLRKLSDVTGKKLMEGSEKMTIAELENASIKDRKPLTAKGDQVRRSILKGGTEAEILSWLKRDCKRVEIEHALQFVQPDWARELLLLIWDNKGAVKKKDLRDYTENELGHPRMSALSLVSNFVNATTNMGLVVESKETLRIVND